MLPVKSIYSNKGYTYKVMVLTQLSICIRKVNNAQVEDYAICESDPS